MPEEPGIQQPAVEAAPTEAQPEPTQETGLTEEQVNKFLLEKPDYLEKALGSLPEDKLKGLPPIEKRISRYVEAESKRIKKAQEEEQKVRQQREAQETTERGWAQQMLQWAAPQTVQQLYEVSRTNPQVFAQIARAREIIARTIPSGPSKEEVILETSRNLSKFLNDKYAGPKYDEAQTIEELIDMAATADSEKRVKEIKAEFTKELNARIAEVRSQLHLSAEQPERGTGQSSRGKSTFTGTQVRAMSLKEYQAHEKEIDEAIREGRYTE